MDSNRWLVVGLFFLMLAAIPFFFAAFGLGWAQRWMVTGFHLAAMPFFFAALGLGWAQRWMVRGFHRMTVLSPASRIHQKDSFPAPNEQDEEYLETRSYA